jgi:hypothetical protein
MREQGLGNRTGADAMNTPGETPRLRARRPAAACGSGIRGLCALAAILVLALPRPAAAAESDLPVIQGKRAVATVDGDPISLDAFNRALAESHSRYVPGMKAGNVNYAGIMNRMINTRLIVFEARNMGLDKMPEFTKLVDEHAKQTLMEMLLERQVKDVTADDGRVEELYREKTRRWKLKSFRFQNEVDIRKAEKQIKGGAGFDAVMEKAVAAGKAEGESQGDEVRDHDLTQPVARHIATMKKGEVSPIVSLGKNGFLIFRLEEVVYPKEEDRALREEARREVRDQMRVEAAGRYVETLKKKYVKMDGDLLDPLDFEAKTPGFDALLKDERVLAEINGEDPIRVKTLAKALKERFYHGMQNAIRSKMVNRKKKEVLAGMVQRRVLHKEALLQGLDKSEEYKERVADYERSALFGAFVDKVIVRDIHLEEADFKKYYKKNKDSFATPKMVRIKQMVFKEKPQALNALRKINSGTDFNWLLSHAEGQVDGNTEALLMFDGNLLSMRTLPEELQKTLADARVGDSLLYVSPAGHFYVLNVYQVIDSKPKTYESVRKEITEEVFSEKVNRSIEDYTDKLKEYYPVKIFAKNLKK